jgi:hypothetical protein
MLDVVVEMQSNIACHYSHVSGHRGLVRLHESQPMLNACGARSGAGGGAQCCVNLMCTTEILLMIAACRRLGPVCL